MKGRSHGFSGMLSGDVDFGIGLPLLWRPQGSAEKVEADVEKIFQGFVLRVNTKEKRIHVDDCDKLTRELEALGYRVCVDRLNVFLDERYRLTIDAPTVHVTDLRCCN
jgi:hypothetical protein